MPNPIRTPASPAAEATRRDGEKPASEDAKQTLPSRTGYNYLARIPSDGADGVMMSAMARLARNKAPRTVIVNTEADKAALRAAIETYKTEGFIGKVVGLLAPGGDEMAKALESESEDTRHKARMVAAAQLASSQEIEIRSAAEDAALASLDPTTTKLYVLGHNGSVGGDGIKFKQSVGPSLKVGFEQLAKELRLRGLPLNYQDVRANMCYGANVPEQDRSAERSRKARVPAAQHFANAMGRAGFLNVKITAYPDRLRIAPGSFEDGQMHRAVARGSKESPKLHRASTVRKVFAPKYPKPVTRGDTRRAAHRPDPPSGVDEHDQGSVQGGRRSTTEHISADAIRQWISPPAGSPPAPATVLRLDPPAHPGHTGRIAGDNDAPHRRPLRRPDTPPSIMQPASTPAGSPSPAPAPAGRPDPPAGPQHTGRAADD